MQLQLILLFFWVFQAYTSQFVSLVMFALMMCDDRISMQERRKEIMLGLKRLPGMKILTHSTCCLREWEING